MNDATVFYTSVFAFVAGSIGLFIRLYFVRKNFHRDERSLRVAEAANELSKSTNELRGIIKLISSAPDPFKELVYAMRKRKPGAFNDNEKRS